MKSVIKGSYKANVGAGAGSGAGAETFWKSEPERKKKVRLHNTARDNINPRIGKEKWIPEQARLYDN